jgi:hypothetical protein
MAEEYQIPEREVLHSLQNTFDEKVRPAMDALVAKEVKRIEDGGR